MNLKKIIILALAAVLSFAASFTFTWLKTGKKQQIALENKQSQKTSKQNEFIDTINQHPAQQTLNMALTEKQLKELVYEVRAKIQQYDNKLQQSETQKQRLQVTQKDLNHDIDKLNNLRVNLVSIVANLKKEQKNLQNTRVQIGKSEKANLMSIATTYDRMDPESASKILTDLSKMKNASGQESIQDVVKILYFMQDRTKANLLAALSTSQPTLAAVLCQKLKKVNTN